MINNTFSNQNAFIGTEKEFKKYCYDLFMKRISKLSKVKWQTEQIMAKIVCYDISQIIKSYIAMAALLLPPFLMCREYDLHFDITNCEFFKVPNDSTQHFIDVLRMIQRIQMMDRMPTGIEFSD